MLTGHSFGVPIRVEFGEHDRIAVAKALPPGWIPGAVALDAPTFRVEDQCQIPSVMGALELYVAELAPGLIFIHAGAVTIDGVGVIVPGRTMAGKSTLIMALVAAGAVYYSDEYAILNEDAMLLPYPRHLHMRPREGGEGMDVDPDTIGTTGSGPAPIALIAHLTFGETWHVGDLSPARRVLALLDNAVAAQSRTPEVLARCSTVAETAVGLSGTRGDAAQTAATIVSLVRGK